MRCFGDRRRFAAEVAEVARGQLRQVDLWAAGRYLTCDDNMAFVPQFRRSVDATLASVRSPAVPPPPFPELSLEDNHRRLLAEGGAEAERRWFMKWGPTTDNVLAFAFGRAGRLYVTFEFPRPEHPVVEERGLVFVAEVERAEMIEVLEGVLGALTE